MKVDSNDPFFKMLTTPQLCDFCMKKDKEICRIILHPIYAPLEDDGQVKGIHCIGYSPAKKCKKCCEK